MEQLADGTLAGLFDCMHYNVASGKVVPHMLFSDVSVKPGKPVSHYFVQEGLLQHNWTWMKESLVREATQVVIPTKYKETVIKLSHKGIAGHLGNKKTFDCILRRFFWLGVQRNVADKYVRSCHMCQITGQINHCT